MVSTHFKRKKHLLELKAWIEKRSMPSTSVIDLPKLGVIVEGIGAGFLRKCEGNYLLMEGYITNPDAPAEDRNRALDLITQHLIVLAKAKGFKRIIAFTKVQNIYLRAIEHGFSPTTSQVLVHSLNS